MTAMNPMTAPAANGIFPSRLAVAVLAAVVCWGCASTDSRSVEARAVAVEGKEALYIAPPQVADSVDSALSRIGWGGGRMSRELRKELAYQFNRKGVATVEEGAPAPDTLTVELSDYAQGNGTASRFAVDATLRTPAGKRRIAFRQEPKGAGAPERDDPALDNIRKIAATLLKESRKDTAAEKGKAKRQQKPEYNPGLLMIF